MGEFTSEGEFVKYYIVTHGGEYPPSFYYNGCQDVFGEVPSEAEMNYFLTRGEPWGKPPWKKLSYHIPNSALDAVWYGFFALLQRFPYHNTSSVDKKGKDHNSLQIQGDFYDERGETVMEGEFDKRWHIRKVHFLRRKIFSSSQEDDDYAFGSFRREKR